MEEFDRGVQMDLFSEKARKSFPIFLVFGLILFFIFTHFFTLKKASAATSPSVITYQGKLLVSSKLATTTQRIYFLLYDQSATGTILYTASGTVGTPLHVSTTPTQGLFSIDLGGSGTNALSPAIFQNNGSVYLEVRIGSDTLTPRKQITASPYALNARYLDGVGANTISSTTYIPISDSSGAFNFRSTTIGALTITSSLYNTAGQTFLGDNLFPGVFGTSTLVVGNIVSTTGAGSQYGSFHTLNLISQQAAATNFTALSGYTQVSSSNSANLGSFSTSISGASGDAAYYGTGSISTLYGLTGSAINAGSGDVVYARGAEVAAGLTGSGNVATMMGLRVYNYLMGSGHVTSSYGIYINNPLDIGSGSVYNNYGLYLEDMTTGTVSNYSIFSTGGQSYHAGNFGIGEVTPASALTVGNGDLFQVDSNGDIIKIKNITYSWPSSQGASSTILQNNGSGTLSWVTTSSLGLGGGGGSGTVNSGLTGQLTYYAADGTTVSGTSTIFILPSKNVGIGTTTPTQKLSVVGNISNIIDSNSGISQIATTSVGLNPSSLYVLGRYAYVVNSYSNTISVVDVSNPAAPVQIATTSIEGNPEHIYVSGRYAYVTNNGSSTISVVDISNPKAPIQIATTSVGGSVRGIFVSGRYAYVNSNVSGTISVVDISNPKSPIQISAIATESGAQSIYVSGRYAYVANYSSSTISVVDISNPAAPVQVATTSVGINPTRIFVSGRYAYTANYTSNNISVVDISNPAAPIQIATTSVGSGPFSIYVSGRYAYVPNYTSNTISVVDISNPANPIQIIAVAAETGPMGIFISGHYAYVANYGANSISVIDISGTEVSSLMAHSAEVGNIQSRNDIFAQGNIMAGTSLVVGAGGIMSQGALSVFASSTGATSSIFGIDSAQTSNIFKVFANGNIGIGTNAPATKLTIAGTMANFLELNQEGSYSMFLGADGSGSFLFNNSSAMKFSLGVNSSRTNFVIDTTGYVGINSSTPMSTFSVQGTVSMLGLGTNIAGNGVCVTVTGTITNAGAASCVPSALQFKTNVTPYTDSAVALFAKLADAGAVANYERKDKAGKRRGLIADYVAEVDKDLVVYNNGEIWSLNFEDFTGLAVYAIAEQQKEINQLKKAFAIDPVSGAAVFGGSTNPGDLAERVDIAVDDSVEPGDVMVVDKDNSDTYRRSTHSYEQSVAGIISTNPTIIVGNGKTDYTAVMAMVGRTPIKVSNENGNIQRGDLLITASTPGYAMKYDPAKDNNNKMVAVIGMALEEFNSSTCSVIPNECEGSLSVGESDRDSSSPADSLGMTFVGKKILSLIRTGWVYNHNFAVENIKNEIQQLANAQGINLDTNPTNLTAQNNNGQIFDANGNLDLKNKSLLNVASIIGKDGKWRIDEWGNLIQKVVTVSGDKETYSLQSSGKQEIIISGTSTLENGSMRVILSGLDQAIIDKTIPLKIMVTPSGETKGVYVAERNYDSFLVKENDNGQSSAPFDWTVIAKVLAPVLPGEEEAGLTSVNVDMPISDNPAEITTATLSEIIPSTITSSSEAVVSTSTSDISSSTLAAP